MKPKKQRIPEVLYYEWRLTAWIMSETRGRLRASGRGIYRELLDQCYGQGSFPDDKNWMCDRCACSPEELEIAWPLIKKHFPLAKKSGYRHNKIADLTRKRYFLFITGQRDRRAGGKMGAEKSNHPIEMDRLASDPVDKKNNRKGSYLPTNLTEPNLTEPNLTQLPMAPPKNWGQWPLTAAAIGEHFDEPDFQFLLKLVYAAKDAMVDIPDPKVILSDTILSKAIRQSYKGDLQTSVGLYLTTVPVCIKSWAKNGVRSRDSPREVPEETEAERRDSDEKTKALLRSRGIYPVGAKETHGA